MKKELDVLEVPCIAIVTLHSRKKGIKSDCYEVVVTYDKDRETRRFFYSLELAKSPEQALSNSMQAITEAMRKRKKGWRNWEFRQRMKRK